MVKTPHKLPKFKNIKIRRNKKKHNERYIDLYLDEIYLCRIHDSELVRFSDALLSYKGNVIKPRQGAYEGYAIEYQVYDEGLDLMASNSDGGSFIARNVNPVYSLAVYYAVLNHAPTLDYYTEIMSGDTCDTQILKSALKVVTYAEIAIDKYRKNKPCVVSDIDDETEEVNVSDLITEFKDECEQLEISISEEEDFEEDDFEGDELTPEEEEEIDAFWANLSKFKQKPISDLKKKKRPRDTLHNLISKMPEKMARYVNEFDVELAFFKSKMVNDNNFQLCGGWGHPHIDDNYELCDRVIQGFKPFANMIMSFTPNDPESQANFKRFQNIHKACLKQKHIETSPLEIEKNWHESDSRVEFNVCQKGTLEDNFDLDALALEYTSWVDADGNIAKQIRKKGKKQLKSYFKDWHRDDENSKVQDWESGLILGYPVLTTIDRCYDCYDDEGVESYKEIVELHKKVEKKAQKENRQRNK